MFYGFFDGSNTHAGAKVWALCGYLMDEAACARLIEEWNAVLDKPEWPNRLKRFHMVDCVHGDGEFVGWSFAERLALLGDLTSVIMGIPCVAVSSVVIAEDFAKLEPEELDLLESEGLGTPLDLSLQSVFQRSINLTRGTSNDEEISLVFDNENPANVERFAELCGVYRDRFGFGKWFAGIAFGDSFKFIPLQAADILAYCTYRYSMQKYPDAPEFDFKVLPAFERMVRQTLHEAKGGFDLDSMKQLAAKIRTKHAEIQAANNQLTNPTSGAIDSSPA
jgi:Protein of unknown function (DUF3800)